MKKSAGQQKKNQNVNNNFIYANLHNAIELHRYKHMLVK